MSTSPNDPSEALAVALFSELITADQLARSRVTKALPKGMEISHLSMLNHLAAAGSERSPAQLARSFHVTKGAMTNTLSKLAWAGYIHIRPDWDDARKKLVTISPAGRAAQRAAIDGIMPILTDVVAEIGEDRVRSALPVLRELRDKLAADSA